MKTLPTKMVGRCRRLQRWSRCAAAEIVSESFMSEYPPFYRDQRRIDADHLRMLAIFHFIAAGLAICGIGFLALHYTVMNTIISDPKLWQGPRNGPRPEQLFAVFQWFYLLGGLSCAAWALANFLTGLFLRARKFRLFSLVVSGFNCLHVPLGTILGVFTIVVLMRESVVELYEGRAIGNSHGTYRSY